jgi:xylulokinase
MAARLVVGIDVGSSSARAVAIDPDGVVRGEARARYPDAATWPAGRADPDAWRRGVAAALEMLRAAVPDAGRPAALSLGGQSPTTVPAAGGLAVTCRHPAGATEPPADQHQRQFDVLSDELGCDVVPMQVWDWLAAQMGGAPRQARWPGDPVMPGYGEVARTGEVIGVADGSDNVRPGTPLVAGAQDAFLAFWAAGTDTPGRALDPGGRTGGLGVAVERALRPNLVYSVQSAAPNVDIVGGPVNGHGLMLEWLSEVTGRPIEDLLASAERVPAGAGGVVALPYLEGERAPRWNRDLRAELVGISPSTGTGELTRAILESAGYGLAHVADELAGYGVYPDVLVCGGSPARSRLWCSIKAAVLELPVEIPEYPDLAAYGAALSAGAGVGWWPKPGEGASGSWPRPAVEVIKPEPRAEYRAGYRRFLELGDAAVARLTGVHYGHR